MTTDGRTAGAALRATFRGDTARLAELWPAVLLASTAAAGLVVAAGAAPALRAPVVLWFVLVCPGMAVVRLLRLGDGVAELAIAIALSAALATLVSAALMYAGAWSPDATLAILAAATVAGAAAQWRRRRD